MDFAWTFWTGKPSRKTKSGPVLILQNKKSSLSKYSTYHSWFTLRNCKFFFFFSKYLLPFLQHICHVATAILTDTEGSGCHFWVLFGDWAPQASLHFLMSACKCHLQKLPAPATWVFASQNPPPNCLLSYSPDPGICSCTMSFKIAAIEPYSIFGLFLPFFDGWFTYTHYFINC